MKPATAHPTTKSGQQRVRFDAEHAQRLDIPVLVGRVAVHLAGILKPWRQQLLGPRVTTKQPPDEIGDQETAENPPEQNPIRETERLVGDHNGDRIQDRCRQ